MNTPQWMAILTKLYAQYQPDYGTVTGRRKERRKTYSKLRGEGGGSKNQKPKNHEAKLRRRRRIATASRNYNRRHC